MPVREALEECAGSASAVRPLLLKLPPENSEELCWTESTLEALLSPFIARGVCDGVVAVNSSIRLARKLLPPQLPDLPGGISGRPLRDVGLEVVSMARKVLGPEALVIGCGGIADATDAQAFRRSGADLLEVYTAVIYRGPAVIAEIARACTAHGTKLEPLGSGRR